MKDDDILKCFGKKETAGNLKDCKTCQYAESCAWYMDNPAPFDRYGRSKTEHFVSLSNYGYSVETAAEPEDAYFDDEQKPGDDVQSYDTPIYSNADLEQILRFLLRDVDDYSLAIVECCLRENHSTASSVAKAFGVSREAMHRKLMGSCKKFPQLAEMFKGTLYRCKQLASIDSRGTIAGRKNAKKNKDKQMEFSFHG